VALEPVEVQRRPSLPGQVDQVGGGGLHTVGEFVRANAARQFGVSNFIQAEPIQVIDGLDVGTLHRAADSTRVLQVLDRVVSVAEQHSGIDRGKKAARPTGGSSRHAAPDGDHGHKGRQVP
jgi:hypothetical protein